MENQTKNNDAWKWIQNGVSAVIIAMIIGAYGKMNDLNDRLIRIEERAIVNTENIANIQTSINRIQMEQMKASDRMSKLEYQISK